MKDTSTAPIRTTRAGPQAILEAAGELIMGKERALRLALACLLARGHLLIEDLPGMGKTTLAHTFARLLGLDFRRLQFTSDLLPADILGVAVFDRESGRFVFHPGPVFAQMLLADEINRATPRTQSALLEAMEERQVSVEGEVRPLPEPFFVIATQNPTYQIGTFPLPESQLDRFLMRIELGYPDAENERRLLAGEDRRSLLARLEPLASPETLLAWQAEVQAVHASPALLEYIRQLLAFSRESGLYQAGLSPRAGLALLAAARAWAWLEDRDHLLPEDVRAVLPAVCRHRLPVSESTTLSDPAEPLLGLPIP